MVLPKLPFTKPKTRGQIMDARQKGKIYGWCVKIPKGRPPKTDALSARTTMSKRPPALACGANNSSCSQESKDERSKTFKLPTERDLVYIETGRA